MVNELEQSVSVIIPVYNGEAFLAEAIESVLAQSCPPLEVLVIDDGSTDGSAAVARGYAPRVRLLSQANSGVGGARNFGIREAHGTVLAFLDADDLWVPDKLAWQLAALAETPALDMVFGRVEIFRDADQAPAPALPEIYAGVIAGAMLVTSAAFARVGEFAPELRFGEFIDWYARAGDCGLQSVLLPEVVMKRRLHAHNLTRAAEDARAGYFDVLRAALQRRKR